MDIQHSYDKEEYVLKTIHTAFNTVRGGLSRLARKQDTPKPGQRDEFNRIILSLIQLEFDVVSYRDTYCT